MLCIAPQSFPPFYRKRFILRRNRPATAANNSGDKNDDGENDNKGNNNDATEKTQRGRRKQQQQGTKHNSDGDDDLDLAEPKPQRGSVDLSSRKKRRKSLHRTGLPASAGTPSEGEKFKAGDDLDGDRRR